MKKAFSIIFAVFILASGMHFSIATHFCGGEIVSKKVSFSGAKASCGMEADDQEDCPNPEGYSTNCCKNTVDAYAVNLNYENISIFKIPEVTKNLVQDIFIPVRVVLTPAYFNLSDNYGVSPPYLLLASSVDLADICIYRI